MIEICISDTSPTTVWVMHLICFTEMHHHYKVKQEQKYFQLLWLWRTKVNGNYRQQCYKFPKSCHVEMHKGICGTLMFFWVQTMKILNVLFEIQLLKLTADNRHFVWSGHTLSQEMVITLHSLHNCSSKSHAPRTVGSSLKIPTHRWGARVWIQSTALCLPLWLRSCTAAWPPPSNSAEGLDSWDCPASKGAAGSLLLLRGTGVLDHSPGSNWHSKGMLK